MIFSGLNSRAIQVQSCRICARRLGALLIGMLAVPRLPTRYALMFIPGCRYHRRLYKSAPDFCTTSWPSLHLRQCGLSLGQPEGHVHGTVQGDGGGQLGTGLLPLAGGGVQGTEAEVTVGLQWTHAEFFGQG